MSKIDYPKALIAELTNLLQGGSAHVSLKDALKGLPTAMRGVVTNDLPYSIWQIVEHIRIAQWDMLEFSKNSAHQSPKWPDEYWVKEAAPPSDAAWRKSIKQIESDLEEFIGLMKKADLYAKIPHGSGQTVLREALQIADHNAYHTAEIVVVRRFIRSMEILKWAMFSPRIDLRRTCAWSAQSQTVQPQPLYPKCHPGRHADYQACDDDCRARLDMDGPLSLRQEIVQPVVGRGEAGCHGTATTLSPICHA